MCDARIYRYDWRKPACRHAICTAVMLAIFCLPYMLGWKVSHVFQIMIWQMIVFLWVMHIVMFWGKSWRLDDEGLSIFKFRKRRKLIRWDELESISSGSVKDAAGKKYPISLEPERFKEFRDDLWDIWSQKFPERCKQEPHKISKSVIIAWDIALVVGALGLFVGVYKVFYAPGSGNDDTYKALLLLIAPGLLVSGAARIHFIFKKKQ